jgi:hypothetical protein
MSIIQKVLSRELVRLASTLLIRLLAIKPNTQKHFKHRTYRELVAYLDELRSCHCGPSLRDLAAHAYLRLEPINPEYLREFPTLRDEVVIALRDIIHYLTDIDEQEQ